MMFDTASNFVDHVKNGKLRALGLTGTKRSPAMPGVPSISETPGMEDYEMSLWLGLLGPAGTAKDVTTLLNREISLALKAPDLVRQMTDAGIDIRLSSPPEFSKLIRDDIVKWGSVIKRAGLKMD